jgi:ABC-type oligopeptide transport system, periplasmic component
MKTRMKADKSGYFYKFISASLCLLGVIFLAACNELEKPKPEPFYAQTAPPPKQEFRWSNGKMPKSFDPAKASAPPETDIVRAVFEGLTDIDAVTLEPIPAVAVKWTASEDFKTWTFHLRKDAKWSNGETVTAKDFVNSWKRLAALGEKTAQRKLLKNIVGLDTENVMPVFASEEIDSTAEKPAESPSPERTPVGANTNTANAAPSAAKTEDRKELKQTENSVAETEKTDEKDFFGVEAVDDFTLKVSLVKPDPDFPSLVAHPIFRPVYGEGKDFETNELNAGIVTNGAFRIASVGRDGVTLDRSEFYWNKSEIHLERVRMVPSESAEKALQAYKAGELDAVTNANFEPLALKLLTPYDDFRRTAHSAINLYQFNKSKPPFDDRRVREALTVGIERERLTEDETEGATQPALNFSPFDEPKIVQDYERARALLAEAGFPNGENFPTIKLLINRNDLQKRIARSVAQMWEKNLNIKTEIIIKEGEEFETAVKNGEYDIVRRGAVLPTTNETANMMAMFPTEETLPEEALENLEQSEAASENQISGDKTAETKEKTKNDNINSTTANAVLGIEREEKAILTEEQALAELPAIPLYFPTSFSLVKPYVQGFDMNALDAPSLKTVRIDNNWQPAGDAAKSNR